MCAAPAHLSTALATNLARYSGDVRSGATSVEPSSCMRSCSAFVFIASITAALSLLTIGAGVPFGMKKAFQVTASKLVSPCSWAVGRSGATGERSRANIAMPFNVPPAICGSAPGVLEHM